MAEVSATIEETKDEWTSLLATPQKSLSTYPTIKQIFELSHPEVTKDTQDAYLFAILAKNILAKCLMVAAREAEEIIFSTLKPSDEGSPFHEGLTNISYKVRYELGKMATPYCFNAVEWDYLIEQAQNSMNAPTRQQIMDMLTQEEIASRAHKALEEYYQPYLNQIPQTKIDGIPIPEMSYNDLRYSWASAYPRDPKKKVMEAALWERGELPQMTQEDADEMWEVFGSYFENKDLEDTEESWEHHRRELFAQHTRPHNFESWYIYLFLTHLWTQNDAESAEEG